MLQSEYAEDDTVYQLKIKVSQSAAPQVTAATRQSKVSLFKFAKTVLDLVLQIFKNYCYYRTCTKNTRTFARRDLMETVSTEPLALHISSPC